MDAMNLWQLFLDTGAPEVYLLYLEQRKLEGTYVPDHSGHRPEGHRVQ